MTRLMRLKMISSLGKIRLTYVIVAKVVVRVLRMEALALYVVVRVSYSE